METTKNSSEKPLKVGYGPAAAIIVTILIYIFSQLVVGILLSILAIAAGWSGAELRDNFMKTVHGQFLVIFATQVIVLWSVWRFLKRRKVSLRSIGLIAPQTRDIYYAVTGYVAYFILFILLGILVAVLLPGIDMKQEQQLGFSKDTTGNALILVFISLVILPPLAEEILMRGFLYTGLRSKLPILQAAIITSVLFGLAHLQWRSGSSLLWVAAIDTFALSLILVYLREKTRSLWSPILVHAFKNGLAFSLIFVFRV